MTTTYTVSPVSSPVQGVVRPPGSKSLTNRALVVSALAAGQTRLTGVLESEDTQVMIDSLNRLGIVIRHDKQQRQIDVVGSAGQPPANRADLWVENSGTTIRFLTALCTLCQGRFRLDGNARMRQRPIANLVTALNSLGADVYCEADNGCPPVVVVGNGLPGGNAIIAGGISSQYLSALLMAAPCTKSPVKIYLSGELVSHPYVDMTLGMMSQFQANVNCSEHDRYEIEPQTYQAGDYQIEPDASAASYFFAAAAITGGSVRVEGLSRNTFQGDVRFVDALEQMGCQVAWQSNSITVRGGSLCGIDIDMNAISDTAQTLAVVAPFADGPTTIRNIAHVRHKETDRIAALATQLQRVGIQVQEHSDGLTINPGLVHAATIQTFNDHRMAMSFALLGLKVPGIKISNPGCTAKTYPQFFNDFEDLCRTGQ